MKILDDVNHDSIPLSYTVEINKDNLQPSLNIEDLVDSIYYVPLELEGKQAIGGIQKILLFEDRFIILDLFHTKSVFIFDTTGRYIHQINTKGRGPGEFYAAYDVSVDIFNRSIDILSKEPTGLKILKHDLDGNFLSEITLPFFANSFTAIDKENYLLYRFSYSFEGDKLDYHFLKIEQKTGNITEKFMPYRHTFIPQEQPQFIMEQNFSKLDDYFSLFPWHSDMIYKYSSGKVSPNISFQINDFSFDRQKLIKLEGDRSAVLKNKDEICCFNPVFETEDLIYFKFNENDISGISGIYYKEADSTVLFKDLVNNINGFPIFLPKGAFESHIIFPFQAEHFKMLVRQNQSLPLKHKEILNKIDSEMKNYDNPVLLIFKLKLPPVYAH